MASIPKNAPDKGYEVSIATVERDTGLSKDTLRMWERRYQFPRP
ncbi:MAG: MerR family transcriptional regulator, partial [Burkholderiales bacterium]